MLKTFQLALFPGILALEPVGYPEMLALERFARLIITDSGGVQREAGFLNKACIIIRDETEWTSLLSRNNVSLLGYDKFESLSETVRGLLETASPTVTDQEDEPFMSAKKILTAITDSL